MFGKHLLPSSQQPQNKNEKKTPEQPNFRRGRCCALPPYPCPASSKIQTLRHQHPSTTHASATWEIQTPTCSSSTNTCFPTCKPKIKQNWKHNAATSSRTLWKEDRREGFASGRGPKNKYIIPRSSAPKNRKAGAFQTMTKWLPARIWNNMGLVRLKFDPFGIFFLKLYSQKNIPWIVFG